MIQIDMEIPTKCMWDCPLCREDGGSCQLVDIKTSDTHRPSDCPLKEVPTGKWVRKFDSVGNVYYWQCDQCNSDSERTSRFCPHCGAKMVEEQQGENK